MKRLILILNGKGGVGKSFFAVNFVQFLKDKGIAHVAIDSDNENSTLKRFHPETLFFDLNNGRILNAAFIALAKTDLVVVDCRAASTDLFIDYFAEIDLSAALASLGAKLTLVVPVTCAEIKAIASGNPLVIEKAQVDAELIRLTRLSSAHAEEQYRIRASLRHSREEVQAWTERLANLREDLTLRQDTSGDKFRIELDKQTLDNRGIAGELLLRRPEKIKTRFGEDIRLGRFAGFDLSVRAGFNNTAELILGGKNSYSTRITDTALGTMGSLESVVQGFEERAARMESDIKDSEKRGTELEAKVGAPFEKKERYHKLVNRQSEIEEKLDLTKNQAPSQVDAAATHERAENSEKQIPKEPVHRAQRAAIRV
jgi:hypothetical protein